MDRSGPLDDWSQVWPRRADSLDSEPQRSIGYTYRSLVLALADGRVITGLPVEELPTGWSSKLRMGHGLSLEPAPLMTAGPATSRSCLKGWPRR